MPAMPRPRSAGSLSPSLLPNAPHRYIPYHKINSTYSFGMRESASPESYACDRMGKLDLTGCQRQLGVRPFAQPSRPSLRHTAPTHRRAVSLSSIPHQPSQGYILLPHRRTGAGGAARARPVPHPLPIKVPSPPLTPIVESPIAPLVKISQPRHQPHQPHHYQQHQRQQQLMLVTPTLAAFLKQGGSVSVRGADGKSWRVRAPVPAAAALVSPTFGMRMMRM